MMVYPQPHEMTVSSGEYLLDASLCGCSLVEFYAELMKSAEGVALIDAPLLDREEYDICVSADGVKISAACAEGFLRAAATLRQLAAKGNGIVQCMHIHDKPELARRGYMIDISRGRMPKTETIKQMIDLSSFEPHGPP